MKKIIKIFKGHFFWFLSGIFLICGIIVLSTSPANAQSSDTTSQTWNPIYDSDFRNDECVSFNPAYPPNYAWSNSCSTNLVGQGDKLDYYAPPNIIRWHTQGAINGALNYTEVWTVGDGTGPGVDFNLKTLAFAGPSGGQDHTGYLFYGEGYLGAGDQIFYKVFINPEGDNGACENQPANCTFLLAYGSPPNVWPGGSTQGEILLAIWSVIQSGIPTHWTVTGTINYL